MQCGLLDRGDMIMVDNGTDTDTSIDISPILVVSDRYGHKFPILTDTFNDIILALVMQYAA